MNILIFSLIGATFLFINSKIILSDLRTKKIPNKNLAQLLILLPFYYLYLYYFDITDISLLKQLLHTAIAILCSFGLFYYGVWSAGDAKYLLVLSLFLPSGGILQFIGNIGLITLGYLGIYFIYFYIYKFIFIKDFRIFLLKNIYTDLYERTISKLKSSEGIFKKNIVIKKILQFFLLFLTIFVAFRLIRIYIIENYLGLDGTTGFIKVIEVLLEKYNIYILLGIILFIFLIFYGVRQLFGRFRHYFFTMIRSMFSSKRNWSIDDINLILTCIAFFFLLSFIGYEIYIDHEDAFEKLYLIFTFYLYMFIIFKILRYFYIITFQIGEEKYIDINDLTAGEIVDKTYLLNLLRSTNMNNDLEYITQMESSLDDSAVEKIKSIYKNVNTFHYENKTPGFNEIKIVRILNTFAFGGYILTGFFITYLFNDFLFKLILKGLSEIIKKILF